MVFQGLNRLICLRPAFTECPAQGTWLTDESDLPVPSGVQSGKTLKAWKLAL